MPDPFVSGNLVSHLAETARISPDQTAIISEQTKQYSSRSFRELYLDVIRCEAHLKRKGISKENKVLLFISPGYELTVVAFAIIRLGAVPVIIDPGMGLKAVLNSIRSTRPDALIAIPLVYWASYGFRKTFKTVNIRILLTSSSFQDQWLGFEVADPRPETPTNADDLAAIVFTSGSTGSPKGVRYLHKNFNAQIKSLKENFHIEHGEVDLATLPIFSLFNPALGVTTVVPDMNPRKPAQACPEKLVNSILAHSVSSAFASPVIGKKLSDYCSAKKMVLPSMKRIFLAGAPSPPKLIENLDKILVSGTVYIPYGATEALPVSFTTASEIQRKKPSILSGEGSLLGKATKDIIIKIFPPFPQIPINPNSNQNQELSRCEVGEICVSGDIVTDGYYRKPGASFDARLEFQNKTYHRMGDLGYFDQEGFLRFLGRKAECLQTQHGPLETERCEPMINDLPEVQRSALIGLGQKNHQEPCIVVQLKNPNLDQKLKAELKTKIQNLLNNAFPDFLFKYIVWEDSIPVDARHNAKIHRLSLSRKWTQSIKKIDGGKVSG